MPYTLECHVDPQHSEARPLVPVFLANKNLFIWLPSPLSAYHGFGILKVELHKTAILLSWNPSVGNTRWVLMWLGGWKTEGAMVFRMLPSFLKSILCLVDWD